MQSKIKVFIATSLDGYTSREDGSIDWLESLDNPELMVHGYHDFLKSVDTIVRGKRSYEKILVLKLNGHIRSARAI